MRLNSMIAAEIEALQAIPKTIRHDPTFIPLHLIGGIGDVILSIDGIRKLSKLYEIIVYTQHIEVFKYFAPEIKAFKLFPSFTWELEYDTIARFNTHPGFHGFLVKSHEELFLRQWELFQSSDQRLHSFCTTHTDKFFLISRYAHEKGLHRADFPLHCLGFKDFPSVSFPSSCRKHCDYITIHDGFDVQSVVSGRATKTWSLGGWKDFIRLFKDKFSHRVIQIGASPTARRIHGVDECLIDKTTISEAFDLISKSALHIDGDSGLVHAAARLRTPSIVLWGPTPDYFYGYPANVNLRSSACEGSCYGLKKNWNDKCPIGFSNPKCMDEITPEQVMEVAEFQL